MISVMQDVTSITIINNSGKSVNLTDLKVIVLKLLKGIFLILNWILHFRKMEEDLCIVLS